MRKSQTVGAGMLLMLTLRFLSHLVGPVDPAVADLPRPDPAIFQEMPAPLPTPHEIPMIGPNGPIVVTIP